MLLSRDVFFDGTEKVIEKVNKHDPSVPPRKCRVISVFAILMVRLLDSVSLKMELNLNTRIQIMKREDT